MHDTNVSVKKKKRLKYLAIFFTSVFGGSVIYWLVYWHSGLYFFFLKDAFTHIRMSSVKVNVSQMIINVLRHLLLYYDTTPPAPPHFFCAVHAASVKGCGKIIKVSFLSEGGNLALSRARLFSLILLHMVTNFYNLALPRAVLVVFVLLVM